MGKIELFVKNYGQHTGGSVTLHGSPGATLYVGITGHNPHHEGHPVGIPPLGQNQGPCWKLCDPHAAWALTDGNRCWSYIPGWVHPGRAQPQLFLGPITHWTSSFRGTIKDFAFWVSSGIALPEPRHSFVQVFVLRCGGFPRASGQFCKHLWKLTFVPGPEPSVRGREVSRSRSLPSQARLTSSHRARDCASALNATETKGW